MNKEQSNIVQIYIAFIVAIIMNFVPSTAVQALGGILLLLIVIATYIYRARADKKSLTFGHMAYLIQSFWISSLLLLIGIFAAYLLGDHTIINNTVDRVMGGMMMTEEQLDAIMMNYLRTNFMVFSLTISPSLIYLTYRVVKGLLLAKDGKNINKPKSWL
ncbi:MAG TPA: hypothetical protein PLF01_02920 [Alphaproteobacteria bacterium]|mgnify:CR=1 FL=1|nr:hypothetical protein [Alphaproteobacteria bacterium]